MAARLFRSDGDSRAKRLAKETEAHTYSPHNEEYNESTFGDFRNYSRRKRVKLQNQDDEIRALHPDAKSIFKGCVITSVGYTNPPANILHQIVVKYGGIWVDYVAGRTSTTHVIAINLPLKKREELWRYRIVKPEWILASVEEGKLLDWRKFGALTAGLSQAMLNFAKDKKKRREADMGSYKMPDYNQIMARAKELLQLPIKNVHHRKEFLTSSFLTNYGERDAPNLTSPSQPEEEEEDECRTPPCHQPERAELPESSFEESRACFSDDGMRPPPGRQPERVEDSSEEEGENDKDYDEVDIVRVAPPYKTSSSSNDLGTRSPRDFPSEIPPTSSGHISISTQNNSSFSEDTPEEPPPPTSVINGVEAYELESIIGQKRHPTNVKPKNKRGKIKLLVKWKGYGENQATWEWEDDLREDLGDDVLDDLLDQFLMQVTERRKALRRKRSQQMGPQRKRSKKSSHSGSQKDSHQKLGSSQIMKPSSQISLRGSTKTAVDHVAEQIEAQPPPQDKDKTLPVGFSFIPDSFSTVYLSDDDVGEADVDDPAQRKPVHATDSIAEVQVEDSFFTPVVLEEEEPGQAIPSQPLSGDIDERAEEEEWDYVLPTPQPWKKTSRLSQLAELPDSLSSVALTDELSDPLAVPPKSHTPPSSPPSAKTLRLANRKRRSPIESPFQTPRKKLKYSDMQSPRAPPSPRESKPQTAEEYNAILLSNPRVRDATALNPDFLRKYFQESRLHHLAIWKAELRARMQERALSSSEPSPKDRANRWVMHVDFDCFFAAVSTRDRPELKDKPVAITHGNSANSMSSEIASCNYAARKFGVKNGNWLGHAKKLCPDLICLGYDFKQYEEASEAFYGVILSIGGERVQAVSVDEALVDISNLICDKPYTDEVSAARTLAKNVRDKCRELTRCEVSVGIGMSIVMARLALRKAKPAGQFVVQRDDTLKFLDVLKIGAFPGVGGTTSTKIYDRFGTGEVHEIRKIPKELLRQTLGQKTGERIYELCRGIDNTLVGAAEAPRQSISVDVNWGVRFVCQEQAETFVYGLAREVEKRMKGESVKGVQGTHLTLKVAKRAKDVPFKTEKFLGCGRCDTVNKSFVFKIPTCDAEIIGQKCVELLRACQISAGELRGIGVGMKGLEEVVKEEVVQRKLQFQPGVGSSSSNMPTLKNLPLQHEVPTQPTRVKEYVKPKVATLFDAFTKRTAARKAELQTSAVLPAIPEPIPEPTATRNNVRLKPPSLIDDELIMRPAEIQPVSASGGFLTPVLKVSTPSTEMRPQFQPVAAPSSSPVLSTQFDIPSPSQIDIGCLPHLPTPLREAILRKQILRDAGEARRLEEGEKGKVQLEQPPNSQWDLETWNTFSQSVRDDIRGEHVAEKEAERKRELAKKNIVSPPKKKQGTLFSIQPSKSPSKKQGPLFGLGSPSKQKPKRPPLVSTVAVPMVYDANGNEVSSWLFAPQDKGGAGIDPDVFVLYDAVSRRSVVSSCVTAHEARLDAQSRARTATKRDQDRLNGALRVQAVRQRPLLVNSLGTEVGSNDPAKVREAVKEWVRNCGDEPWEGDVEALVEFSGEMLKSERRADKATALVRWLTAYLDDREGWEHVAGLVRDRVAEVAERKGWRGLVF